MLSLKEKQNNIYLSLLPFKKTFQSVITNSLYSFQFNKMNINKFLEPQITYLYKELVNEVSKEFNISEEIIWDHFRFYLKGGKALNKLLNKIGNEDLNSLIYSTEELLENKLCFMDKECIEGSNTDYDFTILIKNEEYFPDQDQDQTISVIIISLLQKISDRMNNNSIFESYKKEFIKSLNKKGILNSIYNSFKGVIEDLKKEIQNNVEDDYIINYYKLKVIQIDNFLKILKEKINKKEDFFQDGFVKTTFSTLPISVLLGEDNSVFFLYRLKLFINVDYTFKKLNRDIKDYLRGNFDVSCIPFDNIFGELIDISVITGDDKVLSDLWNSTKIEYMLQPIKTHKNELENTHKQDLGMLFTYPVASLKYQLKDIVTIFNVQKPIKIRKRCQRFIEYLKMLCYSEDIPDPFYIKIGSELEEELEKEKEEIKKRGKFETESYCSELVKILKMLGKKEDKKYVLNRKDLKRIFPTKFCGELISGEFGEKENLLLKIIDYIDNNIQEIEDYILKREKSDIKTVEEMINILKNKDILKQMLSKLNFQSLKTIIKMEENKDYIFSILVKILELDLINRIIPIEINLLS